MTTFKNIFQIAFIIVLFLGTTVSVKAQDIATNQANWTIENAPSIIGINFEDISHNIEIYQKSKVYYLEMKGDLKGIFEGTIFNVEGEEVKVFKVNKSNKNQKFEIATNHLEKGTYVVEIKQGEKKAYKRLYKIEADTAF